MTTRKPHTESRAQMRKGIITHGTRLLEKHGHAGLSLREVARSMGVAPSALYRHVKNRDELLTVLLVESFNRVADHVEKATHTATTPHARLHALTHALLEWAQRHPQQWALMYGTPVPNYAAPAESTNEPGTRVLTLFVHTVAHLGLGTEPASPALTEELARGATDLGADMSPECATGAVLAWMSLIGLINAVQFGQLGPELTDLGSDLLDSWLRNLLGPQTGRTL
ncbi:TetR/AcrR family transcriptional regulator [uncultured Brevibacterium sp.]|uniref:TetR/AcrR family transcriptional regulator n=1 Tax=uncultured Brevibacterium sp. TaxID=189678 RepID=UPI0025CDBE74|nr:TetR/AcrR family transcriptional regulator [uncultured Brevibacterium sp.]